MFVKFSKSTRKDKKMMAVFYDNDKKKLKTVHFGQKSPLYDDFTTHHDEKKRAAYVSRHSVNENFNDYMSAGSLAYYILWYDKNIDVAIHKYAKRFGLTLM